MKIRCDEGYGYRSPRSTCTAEASNFYLEDATHGSPDLGVGLYAVCDTHAEDLHDSFQKDVLLLTEEEFQVALVMES
jgi:hypothetical protein